ncbi:hypothetical protein UPYG_G00070400 [Umbra pygmaea]|uniref:XK-related protein n=1 Tax=Umbra pygmaea TaxID=75934 RepID=A0ABD0XW63_UMBPY
MSLANSEFTKKRWWLTVIGLVLYQVDILTDVVLSVKYFLAGDCLWSVLTLLFVVIASLATNTFSYAWYRDDTLADEEDSRTSEVVRCGLTGFHVCQMGVFMRYSNLVKKGHRVLWPKSPGSTSSRHDHHVLFGHAADLSMLKMFETFLESSPQLLLQFYIMLRHTHFSILQCICMGFSCVNIAWAVVDYHRCLRRSLPEVAEMPCGFPTLFYFLYKLFTIVPRILSLSFLLILTPYCLLGLACLGLFGTLWACLVQTKFCTSKSLEVLYRTIVGVILVFTFFNVKGQNTRLEMGVYYLLYGLVNISGPGLLILLKPEFGATDFFWPMTVVIALGTLVGLGCLCLYYGLFHPKGNTIESDGMDEVDGEMPRESRERIKDFLQL